uniref:FMRFamide receptor n=1 Tax=Lygus hesperus TaxID=30085 RepID=A0A0A9Z9R5_LYGHE
MSVIFGYDALGVVVLYCAMSVLSLLGVVGNVLSIVVWTRPQLKSSSAVLLTALGFSDTFLILTSFPQKLLSILAEYTTLINHRSVVLSFVDRFILPLLVVFGYPLYSIARTISIYLTMAMTLERFIAVCLPFEYQEICSYGRTCKTTAAIVIFAILFNLVTFWKTEIHTATKPDGTIIGFYYTVTEFSGERVLIWFELFFRFLIPLAVIIICNTAICYELKMTSRTRQGITDHQKKEDRLTMMLVYVVFEFLVCYSITAFVAIDNTLDLTPSSLWDRARMVPVENFFDLLNASMNFVSYVTFGKPFRKTLVSMFCIRYSKVPQERSPVNPENQF